MGASLMAAHTPVSKCDLTTGILRLIVFYACFSWVAVPNSRVTYGAPDLRGIQDLRGLGSYHAYPIV